MFQGPTGVPFRGLRDRIPEVANKAARQDVQIVIPAKKYSYQANRNKEPNQKVEKNKM